MDAECVFKRTVILGKNFIIMLQCAVTNYMGWSFLTFLQTVFSGLLLYIGITKRPEISVKSPVVPGSANYRLDNQCFCKSMFKIKSLYHYKKAKIFFASVINQDNRKIHFKYAYSCYFFKKITQRYVLKGIKYAKLSNLLMDYFLLNAPIIHT